LSRDTTQKWENEDIDRAWRRSPEIKEDLLELSGYDLQNLGALYRLGDTEALELADELVRHWYAMMNFADEADRNLSANAEAVSKGVRLIWQQTLETHGAFLRRLDELRTDFQEQVLETEK